MSDERQRSDSAQASATANTAKPAAAQRSGSSAIARRDAMISQLKREIGEEREQSDRLRKAVEDMRFKMQILEQSYAKQLADARQQGAAGGASADAEARIAELEAANEETRQLLSDAQDEIHRLKTEREQLSTETAARSSWAIGPGTAEQESYEEGTINALMDDAKWSPKPEPARAVAGSKPEPRHEDTVVEDLISADWAFASGADED